MSKIDKKTNSIKAFGVDIPVRSKRKPGSRLSGSKVGISSISRKEDDISTCILPRGLYKTREGKLALCQAVSCHNTYSIESKDNLLLEFKEETLCTIEEEKDNISSK